MKKLYEESDIQAIADAIRELAQTTVSYKVSEMARAIRVAGGAVYAPPLPEGYTALSYIKATGGQKINTGIIPNGHTIKVKYEPTMYINDAHLFGTDGGPRQCHFTFYSNRYYWGTGSGESSAGTYSNGVKTLVFNDESKQIILDDVLLGSAGAGSSGNELTICARGTANYQGKIYYFTIIDKSTGDIVRDLWPARRDSDGTVGMFDTIGETFYENAGSGSFIAGPQALTD